MFIINEVFNIIKTFALHFFPNFNAVFLLRENIAEISKSPQDLSILHTLETIVPLPIIPSLYIIKKE